MKNEELSIRFKKTSTQFFKTSTHFYKNEYSVL